MKSIEQAIQVALLITVALHFAQCGNDQQQEHLNQEAKSKPEPTLFSKVPAASSGLTFTNRIEESPQLNYLSYNYIFNGGGVGVGDLNNDSLPDIYFAGNQVGDKLYINQGDLVFEDVTSQALPEDHGWHTGVSMVDINGDGWLDIYVCRAGWQDDPELRANLLYINDKNGTFHEEAKKWGIADTSHSTQGLFFDMDNDNDLDLYVLNHPKERERGSEPFNIEQVRAMISSGKQESDRLYRNDGGRFTDITLKAGISNFAYGLGIVALDIDHDGWMDLYVANDYAEPDMIYMNQRNSTFANEVAKRTKHVANFAMGVDAADINNDGEPDIAVLDMAYKSMERSKQNMGSMAPEKFWGYINAGYHFQYMTNTLQLNNGNGTFNDIAQMAGVAKTDWSWSVIMEDLDNDGWRDMYITNGIWRDVRNNDSQEKLKQLYGQTSGKADFKAAMNTMPVNLVSNVAYKNDKDLRFSDVSNEWGMYEPSTAHGLAIADLDGDGDLDVVTNRSDAEATLYRNNGPKGHYMRVQLKGPDHDRAGLGAVVRISREGLELTSQIQTVRGYQSCSEPIAHFGLGESVGQVRVAVEWPDGRYTEMNNVTVDQKLIVDHALSVSARPTHVTIDPLLLPSTLLGLDKWRHKETLYDDFKEEILLPQRYSQLGPFLCKGDINGDQREDLLVLGAAGSPNSLFIQQVDGSFRSSPQAIFNQNPQREDLGATMFDADGDGDNDLVIVAGGNEHPLGSDLLRPMLLLNDGKGRFSNGSDRLPDLTISSQKVLHADIDGDGDQDLFIAGRVTPGRYPTSPSSYVLRNDGGHFTNVTYEVGPDLMQPGMITDARFVDMNADGDLDLVVVGEWMPISVYENDGGNFILTSDDLGLKGTDGWWYSVLVEDLDKDGDMDIVAGNLGLNTKYHATPEEPFKVYLNDFDGTGTNDIVLALQQDQKLYPVRGRECSSQQMPFIKQKFPTFEGFSKATVDDIYSPQNLKDAFERVAYELRSCVFINSGSGFEKRPLPNRVQVSPVNGILAEDVDQNGTLDLIVVGNNYDTEVETVRYDAGVGLVLLGDGKGGFKEMTPRESGFFADHNAKDMTMITTTNGNFIVVANNNDRLHFFKLRDKVQLGALH